MGKLGLFTDSADSLPTPGERARGATPPAPGALDTFNGAETTGLPGPATNVNELQAQIAALITAFQQAENRLPTPSDSEFWTAYNTLVQRYEQAHQPETFPARANG